MENFKNYVKKLSILSVLIALAAVGFMFYGPEKFVSYTLPYILFMMIAISFMIGKYLINAIEQNFAKFSPRFMGVTFLKMMLSVSIMGIYAFMNKGEAIAFVINFSVIYFIFTTFEIYSLMKISKNQEKQT